MNKNYIDSLSMMIFLQQTSPFPFDDPGDIYPLTIVRDRYSGVYSGAKFTAWNLHSHNIPEDVAGSDPDCMNFWYNDDIVCGKGDTPEQAQNDLFVNLMKLEKSM